MLQYFEEYVMRKSATTLFWLFSYVSVSTKEDSRGDGGSSPGSSDEPKNESYFSPTYFDCFRWMTKVCIFHIDLTLTVAMVTENGRQYRLKYRKCLFRPHFGGFTDSVFKN